MAGVYVCSCVCMGKCMLVLPGDVDRKHIRGLQAIVRGFSPFMRHEYHQSVLSKVGNINL